MRAQSSYNSIRHQKNRGPVLSRPHEKARRQKKDAPNGNKAHGAASNGQDNRSITNVFDQGPYILRKTQFFFALCLLTPTTAHLFAQQGNTSLPNAPTASAPATPAQSTPAQPQATSSSSSASAGPAQTGAGKQAVPKKQEKKLLLPNAPGGSGNRVQYATPGSAQPSTPPPDFGQQPKRILGLMPNYRAVSADVRPPPPTVREKFNTASLNSFDYSAFIFAGIDAEPDYVEKSYPQLGNGWVGYGRYYWRSFTDKAVGNYMTDFLVPIATREDSRYFTIGRGNGFYRTYYAISRLFITPNDEGKNTINLSEIVGKGAEAGIGNLYYPSTEITWTKTGQRWAAQMVRDGLTNVFREFWPDISTHVLHMKPKDQ